MTNIGFKNDVIFKYVFGHNKNKKLLISLLNALLGYRGKEKIIKISLLNPMSIEEYLNDKLSILDIKATDGRGRQYNIKMQVYPDKEYLPRIIYYHDKLFTEQLNKGAPYDELKKQYRYHY